MSDLSRRSFLRGLFSAVPAIVISEELAEALTPKRTIILPPAGGWPSDSKTLGELVTQTFRAHQHEIAANVTGHNALFDLIMKRVRSAEVAMVNDIALSIYSTPSVRR